MIINLKFILSTLFITTSVIFLPFLCLGCGTNESVNDNLLVETPTILLPPEPTSFPTTNSTFELIAEIRPDYSREGAGLGSTIFYADQAEAIIWGSKYGIHKIQGLEIVNTITPEQYGVNSGIIHNDPVDNKIYVEVREDNVENLIAIDPDSFEIIQEIAGFFFPSFDFSPTGQLYAIEHRGVSSGIGDVLHRFNGSEFEELFVTTHPYYLTSKEMRFDDSGGIYLILHDTDYAFPSYINSLIMVYDRHDKEGVCDTILQSSSPINWLDQNNEEVYLRQQTFEGRPGGGITDFNWDVTVKDCEIIESNPSDYTKDGYVKVVANTDDRYLRWILMDDNRIAKTHKVDSTDYVRDTVLFPETMLSPTEYTNSFYFDFLEKRGTYLYAVDNGFANRTSNIHELFEIDRNGNIVSHHSTCHVPNDPIVDPVNSYIYVGCFLDQKVMVFGYVESE